MSVSVVVPIYNERDNVSRLYWELHMVLSTLDITYEMIFVDDGSTDGSLAKLKEAASGDEHVRIVSFRRNYGQTAAMQAGIDMAEHDVIVTIDGDLQNDPGDIPMLLAKLDEGYDLVHGWRKNRQDAFLSRKLPSKIANWLISKVTRFPIHDLGCSLKAMRREVAKELELYGDMHRFIPILAHQRGARCAEVVTRHHPRVAGKTKYGLGRTFRVLLDLVTVKYMIDYFNCPMRAFGSIGMWCFVLSFVTVASTFITKFTRAWDVTGNPLFYLGIVGFVAGIQFLSLGLIGEVCARIYYGGRNQQHYAVRELVNFEEQPLRFRRPARVA